MASPLRHDVTPDICIAGAGLIGLAIALELDARGLAVTVLDAGNPLAQASTAAAGMLAAHDPENPPALQPLADLSLSLYPEFLARVERLTGTAVPLQTSRTLQAVRRVTQPTLSESDLATACPALTPGTHPFIGLDEQSLDPRQLAAALLAAIPNTNIQLHPHCRYLRSELTANGVMIETSTGTFRAATFLDCAGAWSERPITPRKGQLLYVEPPPGLDLTCVVRTHEVYIVPRTAGPNAGRILIGATVEEAGFDTTTTAQGLAHLQGLAGELIPSLAHARVVEFWAGLRPATPDALPLLGQLGPSHFIAAGHFRNGILLAPGTARVMAEILLGKPPSVSLSPYAPQRFESQTAPSPGASDIRPSQP